MARQEIQPQKVTRPFQLLAAWLVTLIAIQGTFLTGARFINTPDWIPAMLSIAAVASLPIVLISMFLLQTRFRAEMQDDRYYAGYLKERQRGSQLAAKVTERMTASGLDLENLVIAQRKLSDLPHAIESEIRSLVRDLRGNLSEQQQIPSKSAADPTAVLALAKGLFAEQDWLEAASAFERYARDRPDDWEASYARGVAYANSRHNEFTNLAALRAYNDAITYAPQTEGYKNLARARVFAYRGAILKRLRRFEEAESDLRIAKQNSTRISERADVAYNLACVYALTDRRDEMLREVRNLANHPIFLTAIRDHLDDYFIAFKDDAELLSLIDMD